MLNITITPYADHIQQNKDWVSVARKAYQVKTAITELKKQEKQLMDNLKILSHQHDSKGGGFLFSKIMRKGSVQYSKIPELQNVDLEPYRGKEIESWKLERK